MITDCIFQSVIFDGPNFQISYMLQEESDEFGAVIRTAVIDTTRFEVEAGEVHESLGALIMAWEAERREQAMKPKR